MSKVALMCGHGKSADGSWDPGTTYGGYTEAGLMLPITKAAVSYLRSYGVEVISDADTNNNKNMIVDVKWANQENVDIYVSIHCDYYKAASGVFPLYVSSAGKKLASCLNTAVVNEVGMKSRGLCKRTDLHELNATNMPACILETGAIKADLNTLKTKYTAYGKAIADGICAYLGVTPKTKSKNSQGDISGKHYEGEYPNTTVKVTKTGNNNAAKLAAKANEFAYASNTKTANYKGGQPKAAYKAAINKYDPQKGNTSASAKGASCDRFVELCVRAAGIDSKYPRGFCPDYTGKCGHFVEVSKSNVQDGDLIFINTKKQKHVCIYYGNKIKEASNGDFYPKTTNTAKARLNAATVIYRAKGTATVVETRNYLMQGDEGDEVVKLQKYYQWYGADLMADGEFGPITKAATIQFQRDHGLEADGKVGPLTLAAMKAVVK